MSYAGKRALVCMKHVGMNVCADAFVNSAITGVNGGLVVLAADDPSMHSSQNEQDSRFYGKFAMIPVFEPSTQQEAYDMMFEAYDLSERLRLPVLMRIVTRLAHSRANVVVREQGAGSREQVGVREQNPLRPDEGRHWVLLPAIAKRQYASLIEKQKDMLSEAEISRFNRLSSLELPFTPTSTPLPNSSRRGIIACGIGYNYVMESGFTGPLLKVSQYPLPEKQIVELAQQCDEILVVEDGQPVVEELTKSILQGAGSREQVAGVNVTGRLTGHLPRAGELTPDCVAAALNPADEKQLSAATYQLSISQRPPQLCQGCGHRDVYGALKEVVAEYEGARVFGDIGCYTLGALPPFQALNSTVDMGASITMAKGAADAGVWPSIAVIGDSTFTHSGMTGLLDAVNDKSNMLVIISDNLTTAMTGGQDSAGTNKFEQICLGLGVEPEHVRVVVPLPKNMEEIKQMMREEIEYQGVSVIIPRRECIQTFRRHAKKG